LYQSLLFDLDGTLAFEDSTSGIASAVGAGIPTVGIATTQAPEIFTDPELMKFLAS